MAVTDNPQQGISADQAETSDRQRGRYNLARCVVVGAFLSIFSLVFILVFLADTDNPQLSSTAEKAFNAILPVLAGWVGTVLAFYFSAASQERLSASLDKSIGQAVAPANDSKSVSEVMIPTEKILDLQRLDDKGHGPDDITLAQLRAIFEPTDANQTKPTRLVFIQTGVFRYVLHKSTLDAFSQQQAKANPSRQELELKLADMVADSATLQIISKLVVFVSATATLRDAKAAMESVPGANDIIVTGTGNASATMQGWLTNADLALAMTAR